MLTFKAETVEDINNAISLLWRMPRNQRVSYLSKARSKLMMRVRRGDDVQDLYLRVQRLLAEQKRRMDKVQSKPEPPQEEAKVVDKRLHELEVGEAMYPKSERYHGLMVVLDEEGYRVTDGQRQTNAHSWYGAIPDEEIENLVDADYPES